MTCDSKFGGWGGGAKNTFFSETLSLSAVPVTNIFSTGGKNFDKCERLTIVTEG